MDSMNHIAIRCLNPTMDAMHTNGYHFSLSFCIDAFSKFEGGYGSSLVGMNACRKERLMEQ
eukprot:1139499-Pelagomonas_calceolata.AAC.1